MITICELGKLSCQCTAALKDVPFCSHCSRCNISLCMACSFTFTFLASASISQKAHWPPLWEMVLLSREPPWGNLRCFQRKTCSGVFQGLEQLLNAVTYAFYIGWLFNQIHRHSCDYQFSLICVSCEAGELSKVISFHSSIRSVTFERSFTTRFEFWVRVQILTRSDIATIKISNYIFALRQLSEVLLSLFLSLSSSLGGIILW